MLAKRKPVEVSENTEWLRLLKNAEEAPLLLEHDGVLFRLSRADAEDGTEEQPSREEVLRMLDRVAGSWGDLDADQLVEEIYEARRIGSRPDDRP